MTLNPTHMTSQAIHASVKKDDYEEWIFSTIYGNPNPRIRDMLWEDLESKAVNIGDGWMIAGDLNDTANQDESSSVADDGNGSQRRRFGDRINRCNLVDLGYSGSKFTWSNNRSGLANIKKRLDRALANSQWRTQFPEGMVQVLPRIYSDHSPLLIRTFGYHQNAFVNRPFRLEAAWLTDVSFANVVSNAWFGKNIFDCIKNFSKEASKWNRNVFGNIFRNKRWTRARIEGIQGAQDNQFSHNLQTLERSLISEFNNILYYPS